MKITNPAAVADVKNASTLNGKLNAYRVPIDAAPAERDKAMREALRFAETVCKRRKTTVTLVIAES